MIKPNLISATNEGLNDTTRTHTIARFKSRPLYMLSQRNKDVRSCVQPEAAR